MAIDVPALIKALDEMEPGRLHFLDRTTGKVLLLLVEDKVGLERIKTTLKAEPQRYSQIPRQDARENFTELEGYVATLHDKGLISMLNKALSSHKPFREFRDILERRFHDKKNWEEFHKKNLEARAVRFLKSIGVTSLK